MNVLIVDDMPEIRRIIRTTLERRLGLQTVEADSVGDALDVLHRRGPFDLVITDLHMPGLSGASFIRRLRAHEDTRGTPILVVSVDALNAEVVQALQADGADSFLAKPFTMEALVERVRTLLNQVSKEPADPLGGAESR